MSADAELQVRPARANDWLAVAALLERTGLPLAGAREHLPTFLLAWRGETLVACAGAESYGGDALLRSVAVTPRAQRSGIGSALVAQALAVACRRGPRAVDLLTTWTAPFFERFGFRTIDGVQRINAATGQRPDHSIASALRLSLDPWLESTAALGPLIDPNVHGCGTVRPHGHRELARPEPDLAMVGVKSHGRAPT